MIAAIFGLIAVIIVWAAFILAVWIALWIDIHDE